MLVVDLHTLQTVDVLHLIDDILLNGSRTFDGQNIRRCNLTIRQCRACTDGVVLLNQNLTRQRNKILSLLAGLRRDNNLTVSTLEFTHGYLAVNFRNDSRH